LRIKPVGASWRCTASWPSSTVVKSAIAHLL
jgi:hypothetical protein